MDPSPRVSDVAHVAERRGEMEDQLVRWADTPSGSGDPEGLAAMRDLLMDELAALPCVAQPIPTGPHGEATILATAHPDAPARVLLSGHYDTVFGPETGFVASTRRDADTLVGPGVIDMKGGLVVMLQALRCLEESRFAGGVGWEVILTPDEETGSQASGPVLAGAAARADVGMVFEPALPIGGIVRDRLGTGEFHLVVTGVAAHSGRDVAAGRNAVVAACEAAAEIHALSDPDRLLTVNVARIDGGGPINVVPDRCVVDIGVRASTAEDAARLEGRIRAIAAVCADRHDVRISVAGRFLRPPRRVDARWEPLASAYVAGGRELGLSIGWADAGGASDGNNLSAAGLPTLDGLGPRGGGMHSAHEHCLLPSLPERAAAAALFLMRLAAGEVPVPSR